MRERKILRVRGRPAVAIQSTEQQEIWFALAQFHRPMAGEITSKPYNFVWRKAGDKLSPIISRLLEHNPIRARPSQGHTVVHDQRGNIMCLRNGYQWLDEADIVALIKITRPEDNAGHIPC